MRLPTGQGLAVRCRSDSIDQGARGTARLLDADQPADAIVAISDVLALGAMQEVQRRGLKPGIDVAVTGFDDSPWASVVSPALTSIRQPIDQIAAALIRQLGDGGREPVGQLLEPELVVRGSSAPD